MGIDEELHQTFDALADRLRDEIARQVQDATRDLAASGERDRAAAEVQSARAFDARLSAGVAAAHAQALEAGRQEGLALGRAEGLADGRRERNDIVRAGSDALTRTVAERLAESIHLLDRAPSLSDILNALASCASREAARVGVLLAGTECLRAWRVIGFGPSLDDAGHFDVAWSDAGIVADTVRSGVASNAADGHQVAPAFADLAPGREMIAVPVPMDGRVVAVLYADQGRDAPAEGDRPATWRATLGVLARYAARCLEAITARRTAQLLAEQSVAPLSSASSADHGGGADARGDEEQSARRYARLLVSEIKLYHEVDVIAGRREGDLATRLGGAIARARGLYEQRVPQPVRQTGDYFYGELVRTLADGDASLIGPFGPEAGAGDGPH